MTRRTDWAEYARPVASDGRASQGDGARARAEADPYGGEVYGGEGTYGGGAGNASDGSESGYGGGPGDERYGADEAGPSDGPDPWGDESPWGGADPWDGAGSSSDGTRDSGRRDGGRRGGARRDDGRRGDGGPRGGGRSRGRRRGGTDAPFGGPQDGGSTPSSRAEKEEPPGDPAERARAICLRLLTGTPRTRKQLADALREREIPEDVAEEVLSRFEEVGLINDGAFADAWVESRHHGRGLARRALARELRTKGVDSTLIDEAVGQLDSEQEEATARELVARKLRSTRGLDRDKRLRRLAGMLARKGYSEGMALRVVRQALEEEGEDTEGLEDGGF
ncbi:recombination regulator RecX [Streptomyces sp. NPDC059785]|uniref:recombination regulator RecX n=1 Tax=unclassified Streptomyces TaxID=2593676 RepID=UPI0036683AC8